MPLPLSDLIIPVREGRPYCLIETIHAFVQSETVDRVIVVDDGMGPIVKDLISAWDTKLGDRFILAEGPREGKGQAVKAGLQHVQQDRTVLCDADLYGMTAGHAWLLCGAFTPDSMVIGITDYTPGVYVPWQVDERHWIAVSGERSLPTEMLRAVDLHGYAMEVQINAEAVRRGIPVEPVNLHGVHGTPRFGRERAQEMMRDGEWLRNHGV